MFKSLSHPSRIIILKKIAQSHDYRMMVKTIYKDMKMSQPVISRHLGILKTSGILNSKKEGIKTYYELNDDDLLVKKIVTIL